MPDPLRDLSRPEFYEWVARYYEVRYPDSDVARIYRAATNDPPITRYGERKIQHQIALSISAEYNKKMPPPSPHDGPNGIGW